jgi:hypothetical protein
MPTPRADGWKGLTLSHMQFLSETEETGTRLSDVASALRTTKQYAGRLAREMASKRLVALVEDACEVRAELEARYLNRLAPSRAAAFVATLKELVAATEG